MNKLVNQAWRFKWRAISYFGFGAAMALAGALTTSSEKTTVKEWVIAVALALAGGFGQIKALFDMSVDEPKAHRSTDNTFSNQAPK